MHRSLLVAVVLAAAAGQAAAASPTLDRIKATGTITFGYRTDAAPFSARQRNGAVRGYSVELCEKVAETVKNALRLPKLDIVWKPVDSETRIADVVDRKIDAECGSTTITLSRMERVDFSLPIFVDGGSALVHVGPGASKPAPASIRDLAGKRIAVLPATTTETALRKALAVASITATLVIVREPGDGIKQLLDGKVDAYASDRLLLVRLRADNAKADELALLDSDFSFEPYALVLPRGDPDFRLLVDRTLAGLYKSGGIDPIFIRWLGSYGQPGALLNAMFYLNALPE